MKAVARGNAFQEALDNGVGDVPAPTGRRLTWAGREWLVHTRHVDAVTGRVWEALTDPELLEQWIGRWRRLPDDGLELLLAFEGEDLLPVVYRVEAFLPGRSFAVSLQDPGADEPCEVRVEVAPSSGGHGTVLTLTHSVTNVALLPHLASGCEYYLDRLVGLLHRRDGEAVAPPGSVDFDEYFLAQAPHYRRMFPVQRERRHKG